MQVTEVLEKNENETALQIRNKHQRELAVVDVALSQILQGLDDFASTEQISDNPRLSRARLILAARSFKSLRIARQVLERGYYQQALTLVRMVMEDQLIAEDAKNYPPTLDALLDDKNKLGRGELALGKMAERISPDARKAWDCEYGDLSERAAHPRRLSMLGLIEFHDDGRKTIKPGSDYNELEVMSVLYYLARQLMLVRHTVCLVTADVGSTWTTDSGPAFKDVDALWRYIDELARQQLSSIDIQVDRDDQ